jgi:hypothetical protein
VAAALATATHTYLLLLALAFELQHDDVGSCIAQQQSCGIIRPLHAQQACRSPVAVHSHCCCAGMVQQQLRLLRLLLVILGL